jgi:cell division septation protein DedD
MGAEAPKAEETPNTTQQAETTAQTPSDLVRFSEALKNARNDAQNDVQNDNSKDAAPKAFAAAAGADPVNVLKFKATSRNDFEVVLGRRQIASCLFAGTMLVAIFAAGSYFAGKMSTPSCAAAASLPTSIRIPAAPLADSSMIQETASAASVKQNGFPFVATATERGLDMQAASSATDPLASLSDFPVTGKTPLFANPQQGALYLQLGALDKNMSAIVAEGLRERGYNSFVAPGASEKLYRVLVGPFATQDEYKRVKTETESIDVNAVAREILAKRAVASK